MMRRAAQGRCFGGCAPVEEKRWLVNIFVMGVVNENRQISHSWGIGLSRACGFVVAIWMVHKMPVVVNVLKR